MKRSEMLDRIQVELNDRQSNSTEVENSDTLAIFILDLIEEAGMIPPRNSLPYCYYTHNDHSDYIDYLLTWDKE